MVDPIQHVLICYGSQLGYHHGAKYQILRSLGLLKSALICVVTDKPELFNNYPVRILPLTQAQLENWSLGGSNHFGIKLKGLKWAIDSSDDRVTKSVLLDTDMYWIKDPNIMMGQVTDDFIAMYQSEGLIVQASKKSIKRYEEGLKDKTVVYGEKSYELSPDSEMWGSAVIGIKHSNNEILSEAFDLFCCLSPLVAAHTVEQFALSEVIRIKKMKKFACKPYVRDWSSTGKKNYATPVLAAFFEEHGEHNFETHLRLIPSIRIKRPATVWLNQKIEQWKNK